MAEIYRASVVKKTKVKKRRKKKVTSFRREIYQLIGKTKSPLAAFAARPDGINFETQLNKEKIILRSL